jgi:hypothetical protein
VVTVVGGAVVDVVVVVVVVDVVESVEVVVGASDVVGSPVVVGAAETLQPAESAVTASKAVQRLPGQRAMSSPPTCAALRMAPIGVCGVKVERELDPGEVFEGVPRGSGGLGVRLLGTRRV